MSIIPLVSLPEIPSHHLAFEAEQPGLSLTWSETPKTGFLVTTLKWLIYPVQDSKLEGNINTKSSMKRNTAQVERNSFVWGGFTDARQNISLYLRRINHKVGRKR